MNKKGESLIFGIVVILAFIYGIYVYEGINEEKMNCVGDNLSMVAYNVKSLNENCNLKQIRINKQNVNFFESCEEAKNKGYDIDISCS